jgi:SET domain-containing protein
MGKKIYVGQSGLPGAGRGVFASAAIKQDEVIENCPILIFDKKDDAHISKTLLMNYIFDYTGRSSMLALGYGSIYNHNIVPNAKYELLEYEGMSEFNNELSITALRPIAKGEEIFINYGPYYDEKFKK